MEEVIKQVVYELHKDFSEFPYKYTSSEQEAQFRVFELLKNKHVTGEIFINRGGSDGPVPSFQNETSPRIRLEWPINNNIHDIVIFKANSKDPNSYEDVEAVIEIKSTWGEYKHLDVQGFLKDFKFVHEYPNIGYYIIFIGNKFNSLSESYQIYYEEKFYTLKNSEEYGFNTGQVYLVFRDKVII